jgi:hypothetical protein
VQPHRIAVVPLGFGRAGGLYCAFDLPSCGRDLSTERSCWLWFSERAPKAQPARKRTGKKDRGDVSTLERPSDWRRDGAQLVGCAKGVSKAQPRGTEGAMLSGKRTEGRQNSVFCRPLFFCRCERHSRRSSGRRCWPLNDAHRRADYLDYRGRMR